MNKIKAIAIDDEPIALNIISSYAAKVSFIDLTQTFVSATEALMYLKQEPVPLIFLDINMPDVNGIEFSTMIDPSVSIIFTTAYPEYAVKGFEINALDYLLKPIAFPRFLQSCQKALDRLSPKNDKEVLFVKDGQSLIRIDLEALLYIEADGNYLTFYERHKKTTIRHKLSDMLAQLSPKAFIRINKSCIIAVKKIEKFDNQSVLINGQSLSVVKNYKEALIELLL